MKRSGFTLVETLVVLGIIALLGAVLFPALGSARARARQSVCLSNLQQLHRAFALYAADHDSFLPPYNNAIAYEGDYDFSGKSDVNYRHFPPRADVLVASLRPYTHSDALWFCPADRYAHQDTATDWGARWQHRGISIDHRDGSYVMDDWPGLVLHPARIDGTSALWHSDTSHGDLILLSDDFESMRTSDACDASAWPHTGFEDILYLEGHVKPLRAPCAP